MLSLFLVFGLWSFLYVFCFFGLCDNVVFLFLFAGFVAVVMLLVLGAQEEG